jgi:predicted metal-dependent phosphotriesterase family hydrolase
MSEKKSKKEETTAKAIKLLYGNITLQPITDEIIARFVAKGAKEDEIRSMMKDGAKYCPERDSFIFPPEIDMPIEFFDEQ